MSTTLLVASAGGHLAELFRLRRRLGDRAKRSVWITSDHPHARSILRDEEAYFLPDAGSRDLLGAGRNAILARSIIKTLRPEWVVSNGASLAVSIFPQLSLAGVRCTFVENSVRVSGPSLTGRILRYVPGVETFTQYESWASETWRLAGSVLDEWEVVEKPNGAVRRVVVTVGTTDWQFRSLMVKLRGVLPREAEILWQSGATVVDGLGIPGVSSLPAERLAQEINAADLVIAHAGIGSAIAAFEAGKLPLLVPRRKERGEAVDNHQVDIGQELHRRGLCVFSEVDALSNAHLQAAVAAAVRPKEDVPPLELEVC
jgi:UDP-N-acetylglucosamine transferase subunit ALG13